MRKTKLNLSDVLTTALYVFCGVVIGLLIGYFTTVHAAKQEYAKTQTETVE